MATQLEKALAYDDLLARHQDIIKQNEQLTELQINQRQEISTLTSELERCKKIEEKALIEKQEAEAKADASAQQALNRDITNTNLHNSIQYNKELQQKLRAELKDTQLQEIKTKAELTNANNKVFELEATIKSNSTSINYLNTELQMQQELVQQTQDEAYTTKIAYINKIQELTDEVGKAKLEYNVSRRTLNEFQIQYQNMKNDYDRSKREKEKTIAERDRYKKELDSLTKDYNDLERTFSEKEKKVEELYLERIEESSNVEKTLSQLKEQNDKLAQQIKDERRSYIAQISALTGGLNPYFGGKDKTLQSLVDEYEKAMGTDRNIFDDCIHLHRQSKLNIERIKSLEETNDSLQKRLNLQSGVIDDSEQTINKQSENIKNLTNEVGSLKDFNTTLEQDVQNLKSTNDTLSASLNDTTYQLCCVLRHIQQFKEMAHPQFEQKAEELLWVNLKPTVAHKDLVFNNIQELETKNQTLVNRIRDLNKKLQEKTVLADDVQAKLDQNHQSFKTVMSQARVNIDKLQEETKTKNSELESVREELEYFKDRVSTTTPGSDYASDDDHAQFVKTAEEQIEIISAELKKTQEEVVTAEAIAAEHRAELNDALSKIRELSDNIQEKNDEVSNLKFDYDTIKDNLDHSEKEKDELRKTVREFQGKDHEYQTQIFTLNTQVQDLSRALTLTKESLENEKAIKENTIDLFKKSTEALSKTTAQLTKDNSTLEHDILKSRNDLEKAECKAAELQGRLDVVQSFNQDAIQEKYVQAAARVESLQDQLNTLKKQIDELNVEKSSLQQKLENTESLLQNISSPNKESTIQQSLERVRQLENEIISYKRIIENSDKDSEEAIKKHEHHVTESRRIIENAFAELEQRSTKIKNLKEALGKENQNHKETKDQLENNCKDLTEEKEKLTSEIADLKSKLGEMENEMGGLKETATRYTEENAKAQSELEERIRLNSEKEKMIEELKTKLDNVEKQLDQAVMHAQNLDDFTKSSKSNYDIRTQQWEVTLSELGNEYRKYNSDVQTILDKAKTDNSITDESMSFENLRTLSEALLSNKNSLEQMLYAKITLLDHTQQLLQEKTTTSNTLENQNKSLCEDNQQLRSQLSHLTSIKEELVCYKIEIESLKKENNKLIKSQETLQAELSAKSKELEEMNNKVADLSGSLKRSQYQVEMLQQMEKQWEKQSSTLIKKYKETDPHALERVKAELEIKKTEHDLTKADLESKKQELEETKASLATCQTNCSELNQKSQRFAKLATDRGRIAVEYKKRYELSEKRLAEKEKSTTEEAPKPTVTGANASGPTAKPATTPTTATSATTTTTAITTASGAAAAATESKQEPDNSESSSGEKATILRPGMKHALEEDGEVEEPATKKIQN